MKKQTVAAQERKKVEFLGGSLRDLKDFPKSAMQDAGFQIDLVAMGLDPSDFDPISTVGPGAMELRVWDDDNTYRVLYVAKFEEAVYILHCFNKKTRKISKADIDIAKKRYNSIKR